MFSSTTLWVLAQLVVVVLSTVAAVVFFRRVYPDGSAGRPAPTAEEATLLLERCGKAGKVLRTHYDQLTRLLKSNLFTQRSARAASQPEIELDEFRTLNLNTTLRIERCVDELNEVLNRYGTTYRRQQQQLQAYAGKSGQLDQVVELLLNNPRSSTSELHRTVSEICAENSRLRTDLSDCRERIADLLVRSSHAERDARVDPLTKLMNRRAWDERIRQLDTTTRPSVAMLDIDSLKAVNDLHGHAAGDAVLSMVGTVLRSIDGIAAFRISGDEFTFLVLRPTEHAAKHVSEQIRSRIEAARVRVGNQNVSATASIGVLHCSHPVANTSLLELVDEALGDAKSLGGNRVKLICTEPDESQGIAGAAAAAGA